MIIIEEYNPTWPDQYELAREAIVGAIAPYIAAIAHVGSTAVPGLAAKPVIDIAVHLTTYPLPATPIAAMEALGYRHRGEFGIPERHYSTTLQPRPQHVHAYSPDNVEWEAHLLFRDYLRAHADAAREYEALKRRLAAAHTDTNAYADDKTAFVQATLAAARATSRSPR